MSSSNSQRQGGRTGGTGRARAKGNKEFLLKAVGNGASVADALRSLNISRSSYNYYRSTDDDFKLRMDRLRGEAPEVEVSEVPDFPEFCERFLGMTLFAHQLQWFDLLEGRDPRDIHPSQSFEPGDRDMLIVNTPPGHAKSTTITTAYVTWRIVRDPTTRVVIVSKTQRLAMQFLLTIQKYLSDEKYRDLWERFAGGEGYRGDSDSWKQTMFYVSSRLRDVAEKDPTCQALGIGGQLYGARADLIVLDDCVDNSNAHEFEKQIHWIESEVASRLPDGGKLLVVGTRLQSQDLYSELRNPRRYSQDGEDDVSPWTYFSQPAVLEFAEDPRDWVTLWPRCDKPSGKAVKPDEDGLYEKWSGEVLAKRRRRVTPSVWSRVYQQEQVAEDTVFPLDVINSCVRGYSPGLLPDSDDFEYGQLGRPGGMNGLYVVAGLDPAAVGYTAAVVAGIDLRTGARWVLDVHNKPAMLPDEMRELIYRWQDKYQIHEWRIEQNAFQRFLTLDSDISTYITSRGGVLSEHLTGRNKNDPSLGVMSMSGLFHNQLIHLPRAQTEGVKALVDQLAYWMPDLPKTAKTDAVMALWFVMLRFAELVTSQRVNTSFVSQNKYTPAYKKASRHVIRVNEMVVNPNILKEPG